MLVKFTSSTSGQIMMFAPVARQLLEIVGKECSARGVITTEQLAEAIASLRRAIAAGSERPPADAERPSDEGRQNDEKETPPVGLAQRAYPMIELLEWTRKDDGFVLWEAATDF